MQNCINAILHQACPDGRTIGPTYEGRVLQALSPSGWRTLFPATVVGRCSGIVLVLSEAVLVIAIEVSIASMASITSTSTSTIAETAFWGMPLRRGRFRAGLDQPHRQENGLKEAIRTGSAFPGDVERGAVID